MPAGNNGNNGKSKGALYHFLWGEEVEFGDCLFYSILSICLLGLLWLFTFELIGIPLGFSLIVWAILVCLIWRQYFRTHPEKLKGRTARKE
jgi:hypothetical protein